MEEKIGALVTPVLGRIDLVLGTGYSAVLYGSAAREEFVAGVSDINLLLVCDALPPGVLRQLGPALGGLRRDRQPPPLLVERAEWLRAVDVFPIEVTDMQLNRRVLRGPDPVEALTVHPTDLRRALEQEFRAKLLRLRQVYALGGNDPKALGLTAAGTVASIAALFRVAVRLFGGTAPVATPAALAAAGALMGVTTAPIVELWGRRAPKGFVCAPELFEGYLSAVAAAVRVIDQFTRGGEG
jgi:predicted nucleotidyltransferase